MGTSYRRLSVGKRVNRNQGGGTKKQGLARRSHHYLMTRKVRRRASSFSKKIYYMNQLQGRVGRYVPSRSRGGVRFRFSYY
tara:strand:- start:738 stop:980 length:243 start_codon:yes stop_codon:yes gene_type:complete